MHLSVGVHLNSGKKCFIFGEDLFFFGLHLICSPEQNCGRGSSPPMLKIGQNWGKIASYPPQCSTKICTPADQLPFTTEIMPQLTRTRMTQFLVLFYTTSWQNASLGADAPHTMT